MSQTNRMFPEERLQHIAQRVLEQKKVFVADLVRELLVSPSSIRNDLAELESRGLISRTYGGAIIAEGTGDQLIIDKSPLKQREDALRAQKDAIGRATADLVRDGEAFAIDGGSTTLIVAAHLAGKRRLSIVTNSYSIVPTLAKIEGVQIHVTGGLLDLDNETLAGDITLEALDRFRVLKAIIGIDGVSLSAGLTAVGANFAAVKRKMMAISSQVIVVCDHTKFEQVCLIPIAMLDAIDFLVTDAGISPQLVDELRRRGPEVIVAPVE
jgi:DeoR/GlpR family transcriptional regulator of sugar metabolism